MAEKEHDYDVALSFAGEDRAYVDDVAKILHALGVRVFYEYETTDLWGKDLFTHLDEVYRKRSKYCVMFISAHCRFRPVAVNGAIAAKFCGPDS